MRHTIVLAAPDDVRGWSEAARRLAAAGVPPERVDWRLETEGDSLFTDAAAPLPAIDPPALPPEFARLARLALCHRDPERFALLYRMLVRLRAEPGLPDNRADPLNARAQALAKAVGRDRHKMTAFVRFREVANAEGPPAFIAWFEPEHHILRLTAPFFVRRFASQNFSILTPGGSAHWDGEHLTFGPGARRADAPDSDRLEALWLTYYAHIFNPARLKVGMMKSEMPVKYWRNLPEAALITPLIREARARTQAMIGTSPRAELARGRAYTPQAPGALDACLACALHADATQAVRGEGPSDAPIMIVGEQPGDREDLAGRPFVGPAGQLLDEALRRVGLDRAALYLTNAVKHFRFAPRGRQRLHKTPSSTHVAACRPWLEQELDTVKARVVVALGVTAATALLGHAVRLSDVRGRVLDLPDGRALIVTHHPAALLRLQSRDEKRIAWRDFLDDLERARALSREAAAPADHPIAPSSAWRSEASE